MAQARDNKQNDISDAQIEAIFSRINAKEMLAFNRDLGINVMTSIVRAAAEAVESAAAVVPSHVETEPDDEEDGEALPLLDET